MPDSLKAWIAKGLEQPGRTQRGLANVLGVHPTRVSRIVRGEREIRPEEIAKAARYFGIPLGDAPGQSFEQHGCFDMPRDLHTAV
jgi:transcriptional regulator with XRE-family HTH domain